MLTNSLRALLKSSLLTLVLLVAQSGFLFSQQSHFSSSKPIAEFATSATAPDVETASSQPSPDFELPATPTPAPATPVMRVAYTPVTAPPKFGEQHRFWDRQNCLLFATVGSLAAADFYATHANLASGGKELNPVTRVFSGSTPALATNFVLETGSVIGASYLLHRTGHHKLERVAAIVNIGVSGGSVAYSFSHR